MSLNGTSDSNRSSQKNAGRSSTQQIDSWRPSKLSFLMKCVWTRDLLIAIGIALVIVVFLYQPVKIEGTAWLRCSPIRTDIHQ